MGLSKSNSTQYQRQRPVGLYQNPIPLVIAINVLPVIVLLVASYFQSIRFAKTNLEDIVQISTRKTNLLLENADTIMRRINLDLQDADPQTAVKVLQRQIYTDFRFREAGILNSEGLLTLSNFGIIDPPQPPASKAGFNPDDPNLQILGPGRTRLMQEQSITLIQSGSGQISGVYLLVDPAILQSFVEALPRSDLGPDGFIAFMTSDQRLLASVGASPPEIFAALQDSRLSAIRITQTTSDGNVTIVGQIDRRWALRYWFQEVLIGAPLTILISALLSYLFIRQVRQSNSLDYELRRGLARDEFEVHYQPILNLITRRCVGSEALLRWRHPQRGLLYPNLFIPIAEQTGCIIPMTEWLLEKVIQDRDMLATQFHDLYISINLSPIQLNTGNVERLVQILRSSDHPSSIVVTFEITENRLLEEQAQVVQDAIARLRRQGVRLAIDDFGTGYSNLGYLQTLEVDQLKLDQLFIRGLEQDRNMAQIVDSLITVADQMGLAIIAEGIETEAQCLYLKDRGVQYGQGWLFSRALPYEDFQRYLHAQDLL